MPASTTDAAFMALALAQARKGLGRTAPNPAVGAVVVRGGKVIAVGHHAKAGGPHAEVVALGRAGARAKGGTLYVTLEPCNHIGRTPPCTEAILAAGVRRVVVAMGDPNPQVKGGGLRRLRRARVEVTRGIGQPEAERLNRAWLKFVASGLPFVTLKAAVTADGRLATATGDSRWVSGPAARRHVHALRNEVDAILVGAGTVEADDPALTTRLRGGRDALRVILDGRLRTKETAKVYAPGHLLLTASTPARTDRRAVEVLPGHKGRLSLLQILRRLGKRGVTHLLVEGGAQVLTEFVAGRFWDELQLFVAPKLAGPKGQPWFSGSSPALMADALALGAFTARTVGPDALLIVERSASDSL